MTSETVRYAQQKTLFIAQLQNLGLLLYFTRHNICLSIKLDEAKCVTPINTGSLSDVF
jgi:hypothetical protein